jgi:uncharacterized protein YndB with AHSA1/START domain
MKPYNWKQFIKRIPIKSSPKAVYDAWTTQQGLESWFLRLARFTTADGRLRLKTEHLQPGDKYKWLWHGHDDQEVEAHEVIEANGWDRFSFIFSGGCTVTVTISQELGETICQLTQLMPMVNEDEQRYYFIECGSGWGFYMVNLKSVLETGYDLRNKNVNLQKVITA